MLQTTRISMLTACVIVLFAIVKVCPGAPPYRTWEEFSKAVRDENGASNIAKLIHAKAVCESVLATTEGPQEVRVSAKLKLASILMNADSNGTTAPEVYNPRRGIALMDSFINTHPKRFDRRYALSVRSIGLARVGRKAEAQKDLDALENDSKTLMEFGGWAGTCHSVFLIEGNTTKQVLIWLGEQASFAPQNKRAGGCAVCILSQFGGPDAKIVADQAADVLRKYHPDEEATKMLLADYDKVKADEAAQDRLRQETAKSREQALAILRESRAKRKAFLDLNNSTTGSVALGEK
jgi:hypothetical protein